MIVIFQTHKLQNGILQGDDWLKITSLYGSTLERIPNLNNKILIYFISKNPQSQSVLLSQKISCRFTSVRNHIRFWQWKISVFIRNYPNTDTYYGFRQWIPNLLCLNLSFCTPRKTITKKVSIYKYFLTQSSAVKLFLLFFRTIFKIISLGQ